MRRTSIRAVVFDLGGVIYGSPVHALRALERRHGVPPGAVGLHLRARGGDGAFAALERGETDAAGFRAAFDAELRGAGIAVPAAAVLAAIESVMDARPQMLGAVRRLRGAGYQVAALTNNATTSIEVSARFDELVPEFDVFIESCRLGTRKPEPAIFAALADALELPLDEMVLLDDLGINLKAARALGMATIKVDAPDDALRELDHLLEQHR